MRDSPWNQSLGAPTRPNPDRNSHHWKNLPMARPADSNPNHRRIRRPVLYPVELRAPVRIVASHRCPPYIGAGRGEGFEPATSCSQSRPLYQAELHDLLNRRRALSGTRPDVKPRFKAGTRPWLANDWVLPANAAQLVGVQHEGIVDRQPISPRAP